VKISILAPNISANCLGRVFILARVLERSYEVEVVGPAFADSVWEPVAAERFEVKSLPVSPSGGGLFRPSRLRELITGDILYACKPLFASYGVALQERRATGRPLVLDIDDWERGFSLQAMASLTPLRKLRYLASSTLKPRMNHSWWNSLIHDRRTALADEVTVSNGFLQRKYGGTIVPHGRDTAGFHPDLHDRASLRARHGFDAGRPVVMFLGTIQPYKGVLDLIEAMALLENGEAVLALVGVADDPHGREAVAQGERLLGARFRSFGMQPFASVPEFLAAADIVVIPQRKTLATVGQMPAKLFDAMAMARPVVATAISDIPAALEGCGWVVEPGSPEPLAAAIDEVLSDPDEAARRGRLAREKCEREFSWEAMERALDPIFSRYDPAKRDRTP
jgi:glycosyltransferase involved in cell wall biosynthesis